MAKELHRSHIEIMDEDDELNGPVHMGNMTNDDDEPNQSTIHD